MESAVIRAVEHDPEPFLRAYAADARSFGGRYVSADLFKEQFYLFNASNESRNRYNAPVHNAAAVLASEQLRRVLIDRSDPRRDTFVFLTGHANDLQGGQQLHARAAPGVSASAVLSANEMAKTQAERSPPRNRKSDDRER